MAQAYAALSGGGQGNAPPQAPASPDLAQMYMAYQQREQAKQDFWGGLAGVAQALHPGRVTPGMVKSITGQGQDAGSLFNNLMQIQQYSQQNLAIQAFQRSVPDLATKLGMTQDQVLALGPQGAATVMAKIAEANAGVSGDPTMQEMNRAKGVYMAQNGITDPHDPRIPDRYNYPEQYKVGVQGDAAKEKEVVATQGNYQGATQAYDDQLAHVNNLLANPKGYAETTGLKGAITPTTALSTDGQRAWQDYKTIMAGQFGSAVQDFPGSRISTKELVADAPSKSTMGLIQAFPDLQKATEDYQQQLLAHRRNLAGKAQQLGGLSDADYDQVDPIYKPGGDLGPKVLNRAPPATIKTPADAANLPAGRAFLLPDGSGKIGYAVRTPADVARLPHGAAFIIPDGSGQIGYAP